MSNGTSKAQATDNASRAWAITNTTQCELEIARTALETFSRFIIDRGFEDPESGKFEVDSATVFIDGILAHLDEAQETLAHAMRVMRGNE